MRTNAQVHDLSNDLVLPTPCSCKDCSKLAKKRVHQEGKCLDSESYDSTSWVGGDVAGRQAVRAPRRTNRQWTDGLTIVEEDVR